MCWDLRCLNVILLPSRLGSRRYLISEITETRPKLEPQQAKRWISFKVKKQNQKVFVGNSNLDKAFDLMCNAKESQYNGYFMSTYLFGISGFHKQLFINSGLIRVYIDISYMYILIDSKRRLNLE